MRRNVKIWLGLAVFAMGGMQMTACAAAPVADGPHTATFRGAEIAYSNYNAEERGDDEPALVFVHGWASAQQVWREQVEGLRGDRRIVTLDLPGYGESEDIEPTHTMDLYADAILAVMDDANIKKAILVGHSNGTPTVRQFYRRHPDRTAGIIVVDGALRRVMDPAQMEPFLQAMEGERYQAFVRQMFSGMGAMMKDAADREMVVEMMMATPQDVMVEGMRAGMDPAIWAGAKEEIDVPLLVVNAVAPFWTEEYVEYVKGLGEDVEYVEMEGVSHFLMLDEGEGFNGKVREWVQGRWK